MSAPAPVLLIAAASGERDGVKEMLERRGHQVTEVDEAAQARTILDTKPDPSLIVVLDLARPEALKFLRAPAVQRAGIPIVCVADRRKPEASSEALRLGIADLVARPVHDDELGAAIANAREFAHTAGGPKPEPAPGIELPAGSVFGASPAIRETLALVRRIAPSRCNVLVLGERGTGRESVARAVHAQSQHRGKPFVKIECATTRGGSLRGARSTRSLRARPSISRRSESCRPTRSSSWSTSPDGAPTQAPTSASSPAPPRASTTGSRGASCEPIWSRRWASSGSSCRRCVSEPRTSRCSPPTS